MKYLDLKINDGILDKDPELVFQVRLLQQYLVKFNLLNLSQVDGKFGSIETKPAVKSFQSLKGLNPSGIVDTLMWNKLFSYSLVTKKDLKTIYSNSKISISQVRDLNYCLNFYQINTFVRMTHFLSQIGHESGGLRYLEELSDGTQYEGRESLGNIYPGDGPKFKGSGVLQLTGRNNYTVFSKEIKDPKILSQGCSYVAKTYPFTSAGFWWSLNKMNALCDQNPTVKEITLKVNGGYNGLPSREQYYSTISKYPLETLF